TEHPHFMRYYKTRINLVSQSEEASLLKYSNKQKLASMNITCLKTLALNILKNGSPDTIASGVEVPELDSCSICNEEIFLHILKKSFTVLICGHTVHRLCLENLRETMFTCPVNNCSAEIEIIEKSPLMRAPSQRSMSIDEGSQDLLFGKNSSVNLDTIVEENSENNNSQNKESSIPNFTTSILPSKRVGEATSAKSSNKKKKSANREDSPILKRLIQELSTNDPRKTVTSQAESTSETNTDSVNFLDLYNKIITSEDINEKTSQDVILSYFHFGKALEDRFNHYRKTNPKRTAQGL
ncbi:1886_t:CDS:1, partial [Gigaspora margarita]